MKSDAGVFAMKAMGDHIFLDSKTVTPVECLHYAMSLPTSVVITGRSEVDRRFPWALDAAEKQENDHNDQNQPHSSRRAITP
jgi:hypothetical protein